MDAISIPELIKALDETSKLAREPGALTPRIPVMATDLLEQSANVIKDLFYGKKDASVKPTWTRVPDVQITFEASKTPTPTHGGPARTVLWKLYLNGEVLLQKYEREKWETPEKRFKAPYEITSLEERLRQILQIEPNPPRDVLKELQTQIEEAGLTVIEVHREDMHELVKAMGQPEHARRYAEIEGQPTYIEVSTFVLEAMVRAALERRDTGPEAP